MPAGSSLANAHHLGSFEARCTCCNYGVVVRMAPERCPMCGTGVWELTRVLVAAPRG